MNQLKTLKEIEKETILARLDLLFGNRVKTAKSLGIGIRTLGRRLADYGFKPVPVKKKEAKP